MGEFHGVAKFIQFVNVCKRKSNDYNISMFFGILQFHYLGVCTLKQVPGVRIVFGSQFSPGLIMNNRTYQWMTINIYISLYIYTLYPEHLQVFRLHLCDFPGFIDKFHDGQGTSGVRSIPRLKKLYRTIGMHSDDLFLPSLAR